MEINPLIAFGAGLVSVFSPCVLIVLPAVMASSTGRGKWRPLAIVLGLSMSFTAMGFLASAFGSAFQSVKGYLDVFAIMIVVVIGVWMLFDWHLPYNAPRLGFVDAVSKRSYALPAEGVLSGLLLGMSLGIAWLPCTGAVLGAILTWVAARGNVLTGGLLLLVYSLGFAVPMLAVAYSTKVSSTLVAKTANTIWIKRAAGLVLLIVGVYLINQRFILLG
jgi:cytochrome c-type biogenesis protein